MADPDPSSASVGRSAPVGRGERRALVASSLLVLATVVAQAPGRIVPETKLDLSVDPVRFLGRALTAWDPSGGFGRVQNQAAGYLFPMGPFSLLGHLLRVPPWLVQRAWIALVLVAALWGAHRLARAIGVGSGPGRLVAAWAYALAPATLTVSGFQSAGQLPYALAPWVLVPLVEAVDGDRPRRVAARSALWVAAMGGVNGASAVAVLPLAVVWFSTRSPGPARRRLAAWWAGAVLAATLWWLIPLLVSVRYGIRFTDFTETAAQTTGTESATEVLRGTGNWIGYLPDPTGYWLPGGRDLAIAPVAVLASSAVAAAGLAGLARRDAPGRAWLLPSALLGAVALGVGYAGPFSGSFSGVAHDLLGGPLAPLRNVHKFAAVLRLPLALGLGHLVAAAAGRTLGGGAATPSGTATPTTVRDESAQIRRGRTGDGSEDAQVSGWSGDWTTDAATTAAGPDGDRPSIATAPRRARSVPPTLAAWTARARRAGPVVAPVAATLALLLAIAPMVPGRVTAPGSFREVPDSWRDAAAWLDEHDGGGRTLLLPGSTFAEYRWGRPLDEPIGALLDGDWAVRDLIPLGGIGSTRLLDGVESALAGDALPVGFAASLHRAGVRYLAVRNDLDLERTGGPRPATVRRLLDEADGLTLAASFGPATTDLDLASEPAEGERAADTEERLGPRPGEAEADALREIDVWAVAPAGAAAAAADPRVAAYPTAGTLVVGGGPEALLQLPPSLTEGRATVLAVDEPAGGLDGTVRVATDTARRRDVAFGTIRDNVTYTLTADQLSPRSGEAPVNLWPADDPVGLTVARITGAAALADSDPIGPLADPEHQPYAAFDGDDATSWVPEDGGVGSWLELTLDGEREVGPVLLRLSSPRGERIGSVTLTTAAGERTVSFAPDGTATSELPDGVTDRVRITIASVIGGTDLGPVGLSEVSIDGVAVGRPLVAAPVQVPGTGSDRSPVADADAAAFERSRRDRYDPDRTDEEGRLDRVVALTSSGRHRLAGTASIRPGAALDALLDQYLADPPDAFGGPLEAEASSRWRDLPAFHPAAAADGDPGTAWISEPQETAPELALSWEGAVEVDELVIDGLGRGTDPIEQVAVIIDGRRVLRTLPASGRIRIAPTRTDRLVLAFPGAGSDVGRRVGVAEVTVPALAGRTTVRPDPTAVVDLPCGEGPEVTVDGVVAATTARATVATLTDGGPVAWEACEPLDLGAGEHRFDGSPAGFLAADTMVVLPHDGVSASAPPRTVEVRTWGREDRTVELGPGEASIVATSENFNDGWSASLDGQRLQPVRVDGWRQGWQVPAGEGGDLQLSYGPGRAHRVGLAIGGAALLALVAAALVGGRRRRTPASWSAPSERPWGEPVALVLAVAVGVALGGPLVVLVLPLLALPRRGRWLPLVGAAAALAAGATTAALPPAEFGTHLGSFSSGPQVAAVVAFVALAASLVPERATLTPGAGSTPSTRGRSGRRRR